MRDKGWDREGEWEDQSDDLRSSLYAFYFYSVKLLSSWGGGGGGGGVGCLVVGGVPPSPTRLKVKNNL